MSYDKKGLLSSKSCAFNGSTEQFVTRYFYDELNRVNKVTSQAGTYIYKYNKQGRIESLTINDKANIVHTYDKAGRLLSKVMNGELLCKYKYDTLNRRVKAEVNDIKWDYAYDQYNQLISAKANDGKIYAYEYDKIGNRLEFNHIAMTYNKLNQIITEGYRYDEWGNLIQTPDASYKYDLLNRLTKVKKNNITVKYSYDPLGQRIETLEIDEKGTKTTRYLLHDMVEQAREIDGAAMYHTLGLDMFKSSSAAGGIGSVLASMTNNSSFDYIYDGNGNVIASFDNYGRIKDKINYSPFGEQLTGTILPFTFSTKSVDASGLSYYGFRFYNSNLGRWINRDPIEENGGWNLYSFARNAPIDILDREGLATLYDCSDNNLHGELGGGLLAYLSVSYDYTVTQCKCCKPGGIVGDYSRRLTSGVVTLSAGAGFDVDFKIKFPRLGISLNFPFHFSLNTMGVNFDFKHEMIDDDCENIHSQPGKFCFDPSLDLGIKSINMTFKGYGIAGTATGTFKAHFCINVSDSVSLSDVSGHIKAIADITIQWKNKTFYRKAEAKVTTNDIWGG
ncbi:MAG: hypothetical protein A2020_13115 [Lentisphaerae bacterium GWF2_45_14]|nr:MAG: hypothetical protein A2020_13115 [Lentisphaerae bacterium GWF2_45_14]